MIKPIFSIALPAPLTGWALSALLALYLLAGTTGHLPWRGDDLTHLGPIYAMLKEGAWLTPRIAGEYFFDFPPLYYWVGALLANALDGLLPVHDAARLASTVFTAAGLYWTALAARRFCGPESFAPAVLLGMGTLGLVVHAHETQPMLAQTAGMALCYAGLAELSLRPTRAALQAGLGAGLAFLGGGLPGAALTLPIIVAGPLLCRDCRTRNILLACGLALLTAFALAGLWIGSLAVWAPDYLSTWWNRELTDNLPRAEYLSSPGKLLQSLGWFSWPLWPIAGWTLWRERRRLKRISLVTPILAGSLALLLIALTGPLRAANMLPVIPPLTLLAAQGVVTLRRGAANAFDWFGAMSFVFFAALVWMGWTALHLGWPPGLARQAIRLAPEFQGGSELGSLALGALITGALVTLPILTRRSPMRGITNWALGMTLLWCLGVTLWQPWFAHTKNYQPIAAELVRLPAVQNGSCIKRRGLLDTHRAALDYFAGIRTVPYRVSEDCQLLLTYSSTTTTTTPQNISKEWAMIWERRLGGGRKAETFRLYRRI